MNPRIRIGKTLSITAMIVLAVPSLGSPRAAAEVAPRATARANERVSEPSAAPSAAPASFAGRVHVFRRAAAPAPGAWDR